jgi:hypothetical protein
MGIMMIRLKINTRHFLDVCKEHERSQQWLEVPLFRWLNDNIGPMKMLKEGEILHGQGWYFGSNLNEIMRDKGLDYERDLAYYVEVEEPVDEKLITEFMLRWS